MQQESGDYPHIINLLEDENFCSLREVMSHTPITWERFSTLDMPAGYSPEQIWTICTLLSKQSAIEIPDRSFVTPDQMMTWFDVNDMTMGIMSKLESYAYPIDDIEHGFIDEPNTHTLISYLARDLSSAAERDGIDVDFSTVEKLVSDERAPQSPEERIIASAYSLLRRVAENGNRSVSHWVLEDFYVLLTQNCSQLKSSKSPRYREQPTYTQGREDEMYDLLYSCLNCRTQIPSYARILNVLLASAIVWDLRPFERFNGLMEVITRHFALIKSGFPFNMSRTLSRAIIGQPRSFSGLAFILHPQLHLGRACLIDARLAV